MPTPTLTAIVTAIGIGNNHGALIVLQLYFQIFGNTHPMLSLINYAVIAR
jgi:hypothetical protein